VPKPNRGIALFGDVIASRSAPIASTDWLRRLSAELDEAYGGQRLAAFAFTQGDELQGLLVSGADPLEAVLRAGFAPDRRAMRWAVAAGAVDVGRGPATERTGAAFLAARAALTRARAERDGLVVSSGDPDSDSLLSEIAPILATLLADLTDRQRAIGRLIIVDGLRQADAATRLRISRPTVSVAVGRAHLREISRLASAIRVLFAQGSAAATPAATTTSTVAASAAAGER
jgi:DNA-binding CsgD family transcriptional regulator